MASMISPLVDCICAVIYAALGLIVLGQTRLNRTGIGFACALGVTAVWAAVSAPSGDTPLDGIPGALDLVRAVTWYLFILHVYRQSSEGGARYARIFALACLFAISLIIGVVRFAPNLSSSNVSLLSGGIGVRLFLAICQLLLLENLYLNTPADARWNLNLACVAIGGISVYDIVLCADAALFRQMSPALIDGRMAAMILVAPLLAVTASRNRKWKIDIHISRQAAFHSVTLLASGIFLLALAAAGEAFRHLAPHWGGVAEVSLVFAGVITVAVLVTSGSARSHINTLLVTHFFSQRYDHRREWLRCIDTLSSMDAYSALHIRVIRAVAQVVDSPGGVLYLREGTSFHWAGSWNMPAATLPVSADHPILPLFKDGETTLDLTSLKDSQKPDDAGSPISLAEFPHAWLAVPLSHAGALTGIVLIARPRAALAVNTEVFGLLRIVSREVATYIAEQRATQILIETRQLRDYGKRFAFVAHDIKNVSSQLSLLLSNAELHMQNPAFQQDMLATVRASVEKISALLKRLQAPAAEMPRIIISPHDQLEQIVERYRHARKVVIDLDADGRPGEVVMSNDAFEAVITHLLDNAVEAASSASPVRLQIRNEARRMIIDIEDRGPGMSPEFIRDRLFQPFSTSKLEGSGIGAFQARELLREVGGDLIVLSELGSGTTMRLMLPLVEDVPYRYTGDPLKDVG